MAIPLRLLIVEDSPDDAELLLRELRRAGDELGSRRVAAHCLPKDRLARLGAAVGRAIQEREVKAEKNRTEQALHESEEQFLRLTENAADIILRYRRGANP